MITGTLRNQVDKLWTEFWTGGITNPLTIIEQISFLMFSRLLDIAETRGEKRATRLGKPFKGQFNSKQQKLRWSNFKNLPAEQMLKLVRDEVFPHFRSLGDSESTFAEYMTDAQLLVQSPSLLVSAVNMINALSRTEGDTKGDLYEYMLGKLTTAGINGQFRSPRHIIRLMVDLIEPKPTDIIGDPACGTAGFLVGVMLYLLEKYTSPKGIILHDDGHPLVAAAAPGCVWRNQTARWQRPIQGTRPPPNPVRWGCPDLSGPTSVQGHHPRRRDQHALAGIGMVYPPVRAERNGPGPGKWIPVHRLSFDRGRVRWLQSGPGQGYHGG